MDQTTLRLLARNAIEKGAIPARLPQRLWGGKGAGTTCVVCGMPVKTTEIGFDLEYPSDVDEFSLESYPLHTRCFEAWELERVAFRDLAGNLPIVPRLTERP